MFKIYFVITLFVFLTACNTTASDTVIRATLGGAVITLNNGQGTITLPATKTVLQQNKVKSLQQSKAQQVCYLYIKYKDRNNKQL